MAGAKQNVMFGRAQRQHVGIGNKRMTHPEEHACLGLGEQLKAQLQKTRSHLFMRRRQPVAQRLGMLAPAPVDQRAIDDAFRQLG